MSSAGFEVITGVVSVSTSVIDIEASFRAGLQPLTVDALRTAGFRVADISAMFPDNVGTKDFACEKNTKAPEGAASGATSGAVLGGVFGWLVGIASGPIMAALAGAPSLRFQ